MSDSQPPVWGPAYDERDLDDLLSGETFGVPGPLRAVAATLAALQADPASAELDREAAARGAFRLFVLPDAAAPARRPA